MVPDKHGFFLGVSAAFKMLWGTDEHARHEQPSVSAQEDEEDSSVYVPMEFKRASAAIARMGKRADALLNKTGDPEDPVAVALEEIVRDIK